MAAYGALVSVMQIMDQLHRHPHPPISLHKEQDESLTANVTFLQKFLEGYNPRVSYSSEADPLESRIAEAAYAAEDVIENYIVDQIYARSTDHGGNISSTQFYQGLEKVIQEMDLIKMEIIEKKMEGVQIMKKQSTTDDAAAGGSFRSSNSTSTQKVSIVVGLDDALYEMLDKITGGERVRQIIPIVGMGGLGKTTLARNIYEHQLVKERFDICAWSTISQVHNARKIITEILDQVGLDNGGDLSEGELGLSLYKHLTGKRYLIVMDDMWNIEAWDKVRSLFPENKNGSRVVVTTRLTNLASMFDYSNRLDMKFLDEASSWNLFRRTVFGEGIFPPELEDVGRKIVQGCRGLPLSIVVVGGLLSKSEPTEENWKVVKENLSSVVNAEDEGSCLQILYTSYNNLPAYIKPCFLYLATFAEDKAIPVFILVREWIAEGIIKPIDGKSLEEAAEEYLEELVDRNLVLVEERGRCGNVDTFKIHDLLRDLCLREAGKDKFLCVLGEQGTHDHFEQDIISSQRRIAGKLKGDPAILQSLKSASLVRSLVGMNFPSTLSSSFRLLRVCMAGDEGEGGRVPLVNLRLLHAEARRHPLLLKTPRRYPIYLLWNLQTLFLGKASDDYILEIWRLPLLRYVLTFSGSLCGSSCLLPDCDPLGDDTDDEEEDDYKEEEEDNNDDDDDDRGEVVMENLHTLGLVNDLKLSEGVLRAIPNIKSLMLSYTYSRIRKSYYDEGEDEDERSEEEDDEKSEEEEDEEEEGDEYCLNNLQRLNKLQELHLTSYGFNPPSMKELSLPYSLKKLMLHNTELRWEEMAPKIGCLPLLQVLELKYNACIGLEWETVEGQFSSLIFLIIEECRLECWTTDNTHFPCLEHLQLRLLKGLREIPSSIGDIPTLQSIEVESCSDSVVESVRRIQEEQEEYDNQVLRIVIS